MDWQDVFTALALMLVLEGILPFLSPKHFRNYVQSIAELSDKAIRIVGLVVIGLGIVALQIIRQ